MAKKEDNFQAWLDEKVPFMAFMDANNYNEDITVGYNGVIYKIKRGEQVMIPRKVFNILMRSAKQDVKTASMISELEKKANF